MRVTFSVLNFDFCESVESLAVSCNQTEEHLFWTYPICLFTIDSLVNHHALQCLGVKCRIDELVLATFEMLEISFFFCWILHQHLGSKRCVPSFHFLFCWSMTARKMIDIVVVLHKQWGEVSKGVLLTKKSPYSFFAIWVAAIKLYGFKFGKFLNQRFVYNQTLIAILARCFILMLTDAYL